MKDVKFTMIEIMAAMVIIIILMTLIMGGASVANRLAKESRCRSQLASLEMVFEQYRTYWGFYPVPDSTSKPMEINEMVWYDSLKGEFPLIDNTVIGFNEHPSEGYYLDPFSEPFYYQIPGVMNVDNFDLWSKGRDLQHGAAGVDDNEDSTVDNMADAQTIKAVDSDDITNWGRE